MCCVHPTNHQTTSHDREAEEAKVIFPNVKDTGLDLNDIPIVIVHNGLHHFVGATFPQPSFRMKYWISVHISNKQGHSRFS